MKKIAIAVVALFVIIAVAGFALVNLRGDAPEEFGLTTEEEAAEASDTDAEDTAEDTEEADDSAEADDTAEADDSTEEAAEAGEVVLDGTWAVADGSEAGYRVVEDLGDVLDFEAVGRTSQVTGSIDVAGTSIDAGSFEVDIASITSDDERRDGQFAGDIMNAAEYPTATLVLTQPIPLGAAPEAGTTVETEAVGDLTLRGVTNSATFPVMAQLLGDQVEIVASIDVLFSDYGIANPSNPFVTVRDEGVVEVRLLLEKG